MRSKYKTKLKQNILNYLIQNKHVSVSARDIYEHLLSGGEQVNLSTVYRNLDRLVIDKKVLKYISEDGKTASYIWADDHKECCEHLHLQCINCGKIIHLDCDCSADFIKQIVIKHDFELTSDNAVLYGECGNCRKKSMKRKIKNATCQ